MYEDKHALLSLNLNLEGWRPRAAEDCYVKSERRPKKKKKKKCNPKKKKKPEGRFLLETSF